MSIPRQPPVLGRAPDDRGGVRAREITLRKKDGNPAVFLESSRAVWDASGNLIRYQGTLVDVTERRKLERQLLQQEEFRRRLLESFPDLILVVDLEERYTFVSSRVRDLLGYQPDDLLGKKISDIQDHSSELAILYNDVASGTRLFGSAEYGARHRDGSWRTMRASASQLFDADGKLGGVIISVRDITTEKKLEQQIVQSERLAAMGAMIGGVAHELNNPLTSILGVSELLQDSQTTDAARKQIGILQQQARRAAEIVHNLTYFSTAAGAGEDSGQSWGGGGAHAQSARLLAAEKQHHRGFSPRAKSALRARRPAPTDAGISEPDLECRAGHPRSPRPGNIAHSPGKYRRVGLGKLSG